MNFLYVLYSIEITVVHNIRTKTVGFKVFWWFSVVNIQDLIRIKIRIRIVLCVSLCPSVRRADLSFIPWITQSIQMHSHALSSFAACFLSHVKWWHLLLDRLLCFDACINTNENCILWTGSFKKYSSVQLFISHKTVIRSPDCRDLEMALRLISFPFPCLLFRWRFFFLNWSVFLLFIYVYLIFFFKNNSVKIGWLTINLNKNVSWKFTCFVNFILMLFFLSVFSDFLLFFCCGFWFAPIKNPSFIILFLIDKFFFLLRFFT